MWQLSVEPAFQSTNWLDCLNCWTYTRRTLAEKLEQGDTNIISVVSTVQATLNGSIVNIAWDGTSRCAYRGKHQSTIAGKPTTIDMWELLLKRENITGLEEDPKALLQIQYNVILTNRTIEQSAYALIPKVEAVRVHTATYNLVGDNFSLFLALPRPQLELWTTSQCTMKTNP